MTLAQMRDLLAVRGIQLTRSLGQNFLHDGNQLSRIVAAAELRSGDQVLEIGPGLGPLTERLLATGARVLAIEKDRRLVDILRERFVREATAAAESLSPAWPAAAPTEGLTESAVTAAIGEPAGGMPRWTLVHADALRWLEDERRDWRGWAVVSNLPYAVASPILVALALTPSPPDRLVVTLQREVGERLTAGPGGRDYGILSLLVQARYAVRVCFAVPRECFFPVPDVDTTCVRLDRHPVELLAANERAVFVRVVKRAFSERRKKALKLLKHDWAAPVLAAAWRELGLDEQVRAERIGLSEFVGLAQRLSRSGDVNGGAGEAQTQNAA